MPPFAGTEEERAALAEHLAGLLAAGLGRGGDAVTPVIPLADPLPQPAPVWLLWALLQLTFFLHLLAMNVVLGGSILALHWRMSRRPEDAAQRTAVTGAFAKALPVAVAAAVTLGVAPLLFVQVLYGRLFLTSSVLMAWWWLAVVPLVILAYYGAYLLAFRGASLGPRAKTVAARRGPALRGGGLSLHVERDALAAPRDLRRGLPGERPGPHPEPRRRDALAPLPPHALRGGGGGRARGRGCYGVFRREREPEMASWAMRKGTVMFGVATAVNIFVGMWFLLAQPKEILIRLVGGDTWAMTLLALGILLGIAAGGFALLALGAKDAAAARRRPRSASSSRP